MDAQLKKGILEMCILNEISKQEIYGYELIKIIKDEFPDVYDGSIYAIMRRLSADNHVSTIIRPSESGPPRKYYSITETGSKFLYDSLKEWREIKNSVQKLGII